MHLLPARWCPACGRPVVLLFLPRFLEIALLQGAKLIEVTGCFQVSGLGCVEGFCMLHGRVKRKRVIKNDTCPNRFLESCVKCHMTCPENLFRPFLRSKTLTLPGKQGKSWGWWTGLWLSETDAHTMCCPLYTLAISCSIVASCFLKGEIVVFWCSDLVRPSWRLMPPEECQKQGKCSAKSWQAGNLIGDYDPYRYGNLIYVYVQRSHFGGESPGLLFTSDDKTGRALNWKKPAIQCAASFHCRKECGALCQPQVQRLRRLALWRCSCSLNIWICLFS